MPTAERTWNDFNADFTYPPTEDAARVANDVKAHVDIWVRNSLAELQQQTKQRTETQLNQLQAQFNSATAALHKADAQLANVITLANQITAENVGQIAIQVKAAADAARDAVAKAAQDWEDKSKQVGKTVGQIAETFAKVGA